MILVDSSAWVEYDRATGSAADRRVRDLLASGSSGATTEPVMMEVLAGARDDRRAESLRRLLLRFAWLPFDPVADFEAAATIYRSCRKAGVTPRGMIDCMICAVALRCGAQVLAHDVDFGRVGLVMSISLDASSLFPSP